ncbi:MAG: T9SS type A sorting domain-containing protein [Crocinitomicaceae bacterium]
MKCVILSLEQTLMRQLSLLICFLSMTTASFSQFGFNRIDTIPVINGSPLPLAWTGGLDFPQFSNIDLNFDGVEDLFVFEKSCNRVLTFIHDGGTTASYTYDPSYEDNFPVLQDWALLVDYNCDGKKDIFTYTIGGGKVYKNTGDAGSGHSFELVKANLKTFLWGSEGFMYISAVDLPGITDIDGDGDIDILAFGVGGQTIEYHKNMSMELYGNCDSLEYETRNLCWGRFKEDASTNLVTLYDTMSYPCNGSIVGEESVLNNDDREDRHAGSTILALDMDNNGVMEVVLGDIAYTNLTLLMNEGTTPNTNSAMNAQDNAFPSNSVSVDINVHPAAFHVDVDNDGIRDLLVAPSSKVGSENRQGIYHYDNTAADLAPVFEYQELGFLQNEMIDVGEVSFPVFFDHNADGLKDLLVSSQGQFDSGTLNQISKISYYENTGTLANPEFTFVTDDYQNISSLGLGNSLVFYPTFGDLDNDGDEDMILGEYTGYAYYMENTGGAGNNAIFNTFSVLNDNLGDPIFEGTFIYPQLVDLDRDGDLDLVNGKRNGKLTYFQNIGNASVPVFEEVTQNLGGVDVSEYWNIEGHSIPQFIDIENDYHLILGSKTGYLHYYDNIDGNLTGNFNLVDSTLEDIHIGTNSAPAIYDLNADNHLEMALGNRRGGLALYKSAALTDVSLEEQNDINFAIYPNPAKGQFTIELGAVLYVQIEDLKVELYDLSGREVKSINPNSSTLTVDVSNLGAGTYVVKISGSNWIESSKIVLN